jgi:hypothetical protein
VGALGREWVAAINATMNGVGALGTLFAPTVYTTHRRVVHNRQTVRRRTSPAPTR